MVLCRVEISWKIFQSREMSVVLVVSILCLGFCTSVRGNIHVAGEIVIQNALRWNYTHMNPTCTDSTGGRNPCQDIRICNFAAASLAIGGWPTLCGWVGKEVPKVCCGLPLVLGSGLIKKVDEEIARKMKCGTKIRSPDLSETTNRFYQILKSLPIVDKSDPNKFDPPLDLEVKPFLIPPVMYTGSRQGDFPWMVSIRKNGSHLCGGSLIDRKHILTAAHGVLGNENQYTVHVGNLYVDDGYIIYVSKITIHPDYENGNDKNLAILTLSEEILSPYFPHICLSGADSAGMNMRGQNTTLLRWGKTNHNGTMGQILRIIGDLTVNPTEKCQGFVNEDDTVEEFDEDFICTETNQSNKKLCEEDYGGPLMYKNNIANTYGFATPWTIVGVDTFGSMCKDAKPLRLFTRVSSHLNWILGTINE